MLKYRTIFVQTLAAFATASVMSCSFAANPFPSETSLLATVASRMNVEEG